MNDTLLELQTLMKNFSSNKGNAEFLLKLAEIYYSLSMGSKIDFKLEQEIKVTNIVDWQSHVSAASFAYNSFNLKPSIESVLLLCNSCILVGDYPRVIHFLTEPDLLKKLPNYFLTLNRILFYTLMKQGLSLQAMQLLHKTTPRYFEKAQQNLAKDNETDDDAVQKNLERMLRANYPPIFKIDNSDEGYIEFCQEMIDDYQRESEIRNHLAINMKWDYDYCLGTAFELHKEGFLRIALEIYALAFVLNPLDNLAEFYSAVSFHLMGEQQVAFNKAKQIIDRYPKEPWAYVVAAHSCVIMFEITGLELILTKADKNNVKLPQLDLIKGFLLEQKGQFKQAVEFYENCNQNSDNEMIANIFSSYVNRIKHERVIW